MSSKQARGREQMGDNSRFWLTLVKVILVQAVSLLLLWALQVRYTP